MMSSTSAGLRFFLDLPDYGRFAHGKIHRSRGYVALDLAYVENWSFWLDLKILVRTAEVVFRGTGT